MAQSKPKTIGLTVKLHLEDKERVLGPVIDVLKKSGVTILVDRAMVQDAPSLVSMPPIDDVQKLDAIVAVGGDGTILRTIRELKPGSVPMITINAGSVGFLSEMPLADVAVRLPPLLEGKGFLEKRTCLAVDVERKGKSVFSAHALNDVVLSQGSISRLLDLKASIGEQFLAMYHADGLIVSTPTGSTAYSLAAGGPVVHPTVSALILTPINPHSFTQKPIVLPGEKPIAITIGSESSPAFFQITVGLTVDGQVYHSLESGDRIVVRADDSVTFLRCDNDAFYSALRTKLKWAEGLQA